MTYDVMKSSTLRICFSSFNWLRSNVSFHHLLIIRLHLSLSWKKYILHHHTYIQYIYLHLTATLICCRPTGSVPCAKTRPCNVKCDASSCQSNLLGVRKGWLENLPIQVWSRWFWELKGDKKKKYLYIYIVYPNPLERLRNWTCFYDH